MIARHIGIVACSAEGAALCYRTICHEAQRQMGPDCHPEVTMHTHSLGRYMEAIHEGRWSVVAELMVDSARKLARAGAEFAVCPDNTIHQSFDEVEPRSPILWIHIARNVAEEARRRGYRRLAVLGTRYLMEGPVYASALGGAGLEHRVPDNVERGTVDSMIFERLVKGVFGDTDRARIYRILGRLADEEGCDAAVLGCTEIPLLIRPQDRGACPLPTLDSTRLLARAAWRRAVEAPA